MAGKKRPDPQGLLSAEFKGNPSFNKTGIFGAISADPVPEEPKQQPKKTAPEIIPDPDPEDKKADPGKVKDLYRRETYWILPEDAQFVKDYAYTERVSARVALGMLLKKAAAAVRQEYAAAGKQLEHHNERKK